MSWLVLVKHSIPEIVPDLSAHKWRLSAEGRDLCKPLAHRLADFSPDVLIASTEPKATETGQQVAALLKCPLEIAENLHEHKREYVPFRPYKDFEAQIRVLFDRPDELVFGEETADEVHQRFAHAVGNIVQQHADQNIVIVTHGTVMTLFLSRLIGIEPFPFWKSLAMPAFVVLILPQLHLVAVVASLTSISNPG